MLRRKGIAESPKMEEPEVKKGPPSLKDAREKRKKEKEREHGRQTNTK